ncbi:hypothetical protein [Pseudonocardia sp. N23]|nr:hypothetical protein [Pseudonocardia sp. N23]GAY11875.1 hypothetical protein TOK_0260 [Pseudonocardia sp. N23]
MPDQTTGTATPTVAGVHAREHHEAEMFCGFGRHGETGGASAARSRWN